MKAIIAVYKLPGLWCFDTVSQMDLKASLPEILKYLSSAESLCLSHCETLENLTLSFKGLA